MVASSSVLLDIALNYWLSLWPTDASLPRSKCESVVQLDWRTWGTARAGKLWASSAAVAAKRWRVRGCGDPSGALCHPLCLCVRSICIAPYCLVQTWRALCVVTSGITLRNLLWNLQQSQDNGDVMAQLRAMNQNDLSSLIGGSGLSAL